MIDAHLHQGFSSQPCLMIEGYFHSSPFITIDMHHPLSAFITMIDHCEYPHYSNVDKGDITHFVNITNVDKGEYPH